MEAERPPRDDRAIRLQYRLAPFGAALGALALPAAGLEGLAGGDLHRIGRLAIDVIYQLFIMELVVLLAVSRHRRRLLQQRAFWIFTLAVAAPWWPAWTAVFMSVRALDVFRVRRVRRLLAAGGADDPVEAIEAHVFTARGVFFAAVATVAMVVASGFAFVRLEPRTDLTAFDGVFWAVTTVTTVGYGDIAPTTTGSKVLAIAVMVVGVSFVGFFTGAIARRFLAGGPGDPPAPGGPADAGTAEVLRRLGDLDEALRGIAERLERLEAGTSGRPGDPRA